MSNHTANHDNNFDDQDPQSELSPPSHNNNSKNEPNPEESSVSHNKPKRPIQPIGDEELTDSHMGLPIGWRQRDIPTGQQILKATTQAYERAKKRLGEDRTILSEDQLEAHSEIIIQASEFAILLPDVVDFALELKGRFLEAVCLHMWNRLLMNLFHKATNYDADKTIQDGMLSRIAFELGFVSNIQSNHGAAVARLKQAIDYALNHASDKDWLHAHIEHFYATCLQIPLEEIQPRANELFAMAKKDRDRTAEMRLYMILAHVYNLYGNFDMGFTYGQQSLVLADLMNKQDNKLLALSQMAPSIYQNPRLKSYSRQILALWQEAIRKNKSLRLYTLYLSQLSPYLYRQKQYDQAYESYLKCVDLCHHMLDKENLVRMVHGLGMTCTQLEKWDEAQTNLNWALKLYKELKQVTNRVWIQHCIGWLNIKRGDIKKGIKLLEIALQDAQELPLHTQRRETLITGIKKDLVDARSQLNSAFS